MAFEMIIRPSELAAHLGDANWAILDSRFALQDTRQGYRQYLLAHIPGAVYVHLDDDLSGRVIPGKTGRHPLPGIEIASRTFGRLGIQEGVQVIVYDDSGGSLAAARAWWMLRWLGFNQAAVLDGGWSAWLQAGFPVRDGEEIRPPAHFVAHPRPELSVSMEQVKRISTDSSYRLVDARARDRFHGENEVIDPIAGHIPGAVNAPYQEIMSASGALADREQLRIFYQGLLHEIPAERAVFYCGSGVSAVMHILGMMEAGMGEGRLYAGSWSEWITDPARDIER